MKILLLVLMGFSMPAVAQDWAAKFANDVRWPSSTENFGFKSLRIGEPVRLDGPFFAVNAVMDWQMRPFQCEYANKTPMFVSCKLVIIENEPPRLRNKDGSPGEYYPKDIINLEQAFGEEVSITFLVALDNTPDTEKIRVFNRFEGISSHMGGGRIIEITIINNRRSDEFVTNAVKHFTTIFGHIPIQLNSERSKESAVSPRCESILKVIYSKPQSMLSPIEIAQKLDCELETAVRIGQGRDSDRKASGYVWQDSDENKAVLLLDSSKSNDYGGTARSASIRLLLRSKDIALRNVFQEIKDSSQQKQDERQRRNSIDF